MILNNIIKITLCIVIFINILIIDDLTTNYINENLVKLNEQQNYLIINNISNIPLIYISVEDIQYTYSIQFGLIEVKYFINLFDANFNNIKPSRALSLYDIKFLCNIYLYDINKNIFSIANIYNNRLFLCVEYINIKDQINFGVTVYKIDTTKEGIEYYQHFFFSDIIFNLNQNSSEENNNKFNINYIYENFNKLLNKIKKYKNNASYLNEAYNLKSSFIQPPLFSLKKDIAQVEGKWYFNNIYETYFCFCTGDSCISLSTFNTYYFQNCKYFFYLTIIDNNKDLYSKTDYLLSDFFDEKIASSDVFPIFKEMISKNMKAHYLTMSYNIYNQFCLNNTKCNYESQIIYGIKKITGETLEKLLVLLLRLKAVITAEKYYCIDNLFYNIDYITYIFLGHGVTYIKSFLYKNYLSPKVYNKILLPPYEKFLQLAIEAGWKNEDIIKTGYPRWDDYDIFGSNSKKQERNIFLMFTWRKLKKGKKISDEYYNNLYKLLNSKRLNKQLNINNVKIFFCLHHALKDSIKIKFNEKNIRIIEQNDISTLLKNSSLIITDFSSILFDAIVQRKPLILFLPDGLDPNLYDNYQDDYWETINRIKFGKICLYEVFLELKKVINKIIYYIRNDFKLEEEKLKFYKKFRLKNYGNTKRFIKYLRHIK